jgi:hypothetical protein
MAKKKAEAATREPEWGVFILKKKAQRVGSVQARTKEEAPERAYEELAVAPGDRFRISVQRA